MDFLKIPKFSGIKERKVNQKQKPFLLAEVDTFLEKGAIEIVSKIKSGKVFTAHFSWFKRKMEK